jgi:hypothetical protein
MQCPLCDRDMIPGPSLDEHHLIPKTFKGKDLETCHKVCHNKIHATFSERELLNYYHTWERLRDHEEIQKFIKWVAKKPPEYFDISKETKDRKSKRRK